MSAALIASAIALDFANDALSSTLRSAVENWKQWRTMSSRKTWKKGVAATYASVNAKRITGSAKYVSSSHAGQMMANTSVRARFHNLSPSRGSTRERFTMSGKITSESDCWTMLTSGTW
jgi:hypothetical protein